MLLIFGIINNKYFAQKDANSLNNSKRKKKVLNKSKQKYVCEEYLISYHRWQQLERFNFVL